MQVSQRNLYGGMRLTARDAYGTPLYAGPRNLEEEHCNTILRILVNCQVLPKCTYYLFSTILKYIIK